MKPKLSPDEACVVLLAMFSDSKASRPVLVGPASILLGPLWSLDDTQALFDRLVDEGRIRSLTPEERYRFDLPEGYVPV